MGKELLCPSFSSPGAKGGKKEGRKCLFLDLLDSNAGNGGTIKAVVIVRGEAVKNMKREGGRRPSIKSRLTTLPGEKKGEEMHYTGKWDLCLKHLNNLVF